MIPAGRKFEMMLVGSRSEQVPLLIQPGAAQLRPYVVTLGLRFFASLMSLAIGLDAKRLISIRLWGSN
jgi:hypothetical protein